MTSIRDIAALAGVAPSTVSRYLNQSGYVSQKREKRFKPSSMPLTTVPT